MFLMCLEHVEPQSSSLEPSFAGNRLLLPFPPRGGGLSFGPVCRWPKKSRDVLCWWRRGHPNLNLFYLVWCMCDVVCVFFHTINYNYIIEVSISIGSVPYCSMTGFRHAKHCAISLAIPLRPLNNHQRCNISIQHDIAIPICMLKLWPTPTAIRPMGSHFGNYCII